MNYRYNTFTCLLLVGALTLCGCVSPRQAEARLEQERAALEGAMPVRTTPEGWAVMNRSRASMAISEVSDPAPGVISDMQVNNAANAQTWPVKLERKYPFPFVPCYPTAPANVAKRNPFRGEVFTQGKNGRMIKLSGSEKEFGAAFMLPLYVKTSSGEFLRLN